MISALPVFPRLPLVWLSSCTVEDGVLTVDDEPSSCTVEDGVLTVDDELSSCTTEDVVPAVAAAPTAAPTEDNWLSMIEQKMPQII